jgi:hypothetical protein
MTGFASESFAWRVELHDGRAAPLRFAHSVCFASLRSAAISKGVQTWVYGHSFWPWRCLERRLLELWARGRLERAGGTAFFTPIAHRNIET